MKQLRAFIPWTDVTFSREGTHRDRVLIDGGQVIRESAIDVPNAVKARRQKATEHWNEAGTEQSLAQVVATIEMRHDHILSIVDSRQRYVDLAVDPFVSIRWQVLLKAIQQDCVDIETGTKCAQLVGTGLLADTQHLIGDFGWNRRDGN